ncbi:MAG: diguanylate cyclase domain-containing protein [Candidatus Weimeria sp.]
MEGIYIGIHVAALAVTFLTLIYVLSATPSRAQVAVSFFIMSGIFYIFGFLCEITTDSLGGAITSTKMQYLGLLLVFIGMLFSIQELLHLKIPKWIYFVQSAVSVIVMWGIFTWDKNHLIYKGVRMDRSGPFPTMKIIEYGPLFYLYVIYGALSCAFCVFCGLKGIKKNNPFQKKRLQYLLGVVIFCWLPFIIKISGIFGDYEMPAIGVAGVGVCMGMAFGRYSYLDSVSVSMINAINRGDEGIVIIDFADRIMYHNEASQEIIGEFSDHDSVEHITLLEEGLSAEDNRLTIGDRTYEFRSENIREKNIVIGKIVMIIDMTDHVRYLEMVEKTAITDSLTGVHNRLWFEEKVTDALSEQMTGSFFMIDLDNFKQVNDRFGHQEGDNVLIELATVLKANGKNGWIGRIGGDEFCMFFPGLVEKDVAMERGRKLIKGYKKALSDRPCGSLTSMSAGIVIIDQNTYRKGEVSYNEVYHRADEELYKAKKAGKGVCRSTILCFSH